MALPLSYNVRNVRVRWQVTLLSIVGIALVVTVFAILMSLRLKLLLELGKLRGELVEDLSDGGAGDCNRLSSASVGPERGWDVDVHA